MCATLGHPRPQIVQTGYDRIDLPWSDEALRDLGSRILKSEVSFQLSELDAQSICFVLDNCAHFLARRGARHHFQSNLHAPQLTQNAIATVMPMGTKEILILIEHSSARLLASTSAARLRSPFVISLMMRRR